MSVFADLLNEALGRRDRIPDLVRERGGELFDVLRVAGF